MTQRGFTLIELAIALAVVGLIIGMGFKGRDLIDSARARSLQAQVMRIGLALQVYREKYDRLPGDGCTKTTGAVCPGMADGMLDAAEAELAWSVLAEAGILNRTERQAAPGGQWRFRQDDTRLWLDLDVERRFACQLDRQMDDGLSQQGSVRGLGAAADGWGASDDCWSLGGMATVGARIVP